MRGGGGRERAVHLGGQLGEAPRDAGVTETGGGVQRRDLQRGLTLRRGEHGRSPGGRGGLADRALGRRHPRLGQQDVRRHEHQRRVLGGPGPLQRPPRLGRVARHRERGRQPQRQAERPAAGVGALDPGDRLPQQPHGAPHLPAVAHHLGVGAAGEQVPGAGNGPRRLVEPPRRVLGVVQPAGEPQRPHPRVEPADPYLAGAVGDGQRLDPGHGLAEAVEAAEPAARRSQPPPCQRHRLRGRPRRHDGARRGGGPPGAGEERVEDRAHRGQRVARGRVADGGLRLGENRLRVVRAGQSPEQVPGPRQRRPDALGVVARERLQRGQLLLGLGAVAGPCERVAEDEPHRRSAARPHGRRREPGRQREVQHFQRGARSGGEDVRVVGKVGVEHEHGAAERVVRPARPGARQCPGDAAAPPARAQPPA
ncbi:hypothetical protein amrb99_55130 [Actinomadura sp. RB99]|nr:hypothetical protein [Actinomadura sp. RB99]